MIRKGGERLGFLNLLATFGHKKVQWLRPQRYAIPACTSLAWEDSQETLEVVTTEGVAEIRDPKLHEVGFHRLSKMLTTRVSFSPVTHRCIIPSARQPPCWIWHIAAHPSSFWHEFTHIATGTQKNSVLGVGKIGPVEFCTTGREKLGGKIKPNLAQS